MGLCASVCHWELVLKMSSQIRVWVVVFLVLQSEDGNAAKTHVSVSKTLTLQGVLRLLRTGEMGKSVYRLSVSPAHVTSAAVLSRKIHGQVLLYATVGNMTSQMNAGEGPGCGRGCLSPLTHTQFQMCETHLAVPWISIISRSCGCFNHCFDP